MFGNNNLCRCPSCGESLTPTLQHLASMSPLSPSFQASASMCPACGEVFVIQHQIRAITDGERKLMEMAREHVDSEDVSDLDLVKVAVDNMPGDISYIDMREMLVELTDESDFPSTLDDPPSPN